MSDFRKQVRWFRSMLFSLALIPMVLYSQTREQKKVFAQAESYFLFEDYDLALKLYLLLDTPDNFNIKYKIGTCFLNLPGEKDKSIAYLEEATKNVSFESKTRSLVEKKAPIDAYFFLAKAYMINNEPELGLTTLRTLKQITLDSKTGKGVRNPEYIDQQIEACNNLIVLKETPVAFDKEIAGNNFSHGSANVNPAVSFDGNTLVFTEKNGGSNIILMSKKGENGKWNQPVDITGQLKAGTDCSSCSLNSDGTELFLYKTGNFDGSIFSSDFVNGKWMPMKALNSKINSKYYESHASVSADGKRLYFASNRNGGMGNLDLYVSEREESGSWGTPVNLGPTVNTTFNEDTPFVTMNDSLLFFSSEGHKTIGGYDIFKCTIKNGDWNDPVNIGFPFNTPDDDKFFQPVNNADNGYYADVSDSGKEEIFYFTFAKPATTGKPEIEKETFVSSTPAEEAVKEDVARVELPPPPPPAAPVEQEKNDASVRVVDPSVNIKDSEVLYYTVQLIALHKPVDISYFKNVNDVKVIYNDADKFFRYTTGRFSFREEAETLKAELIRKGYPSEIFIKKVIKQ